MLPIAFASLIALLQNVLLLVLGVLTITWLEDLTGGWTRWRRQALVGVAFAALAAFAVIQPWQLEPGIQIDSRSVMVGLAVAFGGPLSGAMVALVAGLLRLWIGGLAAHVGALAVLSMFVLACLLNWPFRREARPLRYFDLVALGFAAALTMLLPSFILPWDTAVAIFSRTVVPVLAIIPAATVLLGAILLRAERQRRRERKAADNDAHMRSLIDNLPEPVGIVDREGRYMFVNKAFERANKVDRVAAIGQPRRDFWRMAGLGEIERELAARLDSPESFRLDPLEVTRDGKSRWVSFMQIPIQNADGERDGVAGISMDVTALWNARAALESREAMARRHKESLLAALRFVSADGLAHMPPLADTFRSITEIVADGLQADRTSVYNFDRLRGSLIGINSWRRKERRHLEPVELSHLLVSQLFDDVKMQQVIAFSDVSEDSRLAPWRDALASENIRSGLIASIYVANEIVGWLTVAQETAPRDWTAEEATFARSMADILGMFILTNRYRDTLEALDLVSEAIYVQGQGERIIYANHAALILAGEPNPSAFFARAINLPPSAFPAPSAPLQGRQDDTELDWGGGQPRTLHIERTRHPSGNVVTIISDVTEQRSQAQERERLQARLGQASKTQAIGQLAGGVAHDFNNLLGSISGFAELLAQDLPADTEQHLFARRILNACQRGRSLVSQILAFARAENVERRPVDLCDVLREGRDLISVSLKASTSLTLSLPGAPVMVSANEAQLAQVLLNLCINADSAIGDGPGTIRIDLERVTAPQAARHVTDVAADRLAIGEIKSDKPYACIRVSDNGCGMPPEVLGRVFEPFFTTKRGGRGTGLGLAVVHGLVMSYEGACVVESSPGAGSVFSVYLPLAPANARDRSRTVAEFAEVARPASRERVLVVDDEEDIADALVIALQRMGFEAVGLGDPREALEAIRSGGVDWDAIVTDQTMPGMTGIALAEEVRALRPDMAVVLCSGFADAGERAGPAGGLVDAVLQKPIEPHHVAMALRSALERRNRPASD